MTSADIAPIIQAVGLLITSIASAAGVFVSLRNGQKVTKLAKDVHTIEIATNSMKDALVDKTDKAARAEGTAAGLQQGRDEHAPLKVAIVDVPASLKEPK